MTNAICRARVGAYIIIVLGIILAAMWSVRPFFTAGYKLSLIGLAAALTPYYLYALITAAKRAVVIILPGILLLLVQVIVQFGSYLQWPEMGALTAWLPLWQSVIVLPVGVLSAWALSALTRGQRPPPPASRRRRRHSRGTAAAGDNWKNAMAVALVAAATTSGAQPI